MSDDKKYSSVHYSDYLALDKILDAQHLRSEEVGEKPAHDETLFIIVHQVYELWFKEILHDLDSVMEMFQSDSVNERNIGRAVERMERIIEIQQLLIRQIRVIETIKPLDFLEFRNYLFPASGFQSMQFRKIEVKLGLEMDQRVTYNDEHYHAEFSKQRREEMMKLEEEPSMLELVNDWLERTPFLEFKDFNFLEQYKQAVQDMIGREQKQIKDSGYLDEHEKEMRLKMLGDTDTYFANVLDEEYHNEMVEQGELRFSYKATIAALLINLYRDEPILHMPYVFLDRLKDIDELLTGWRNRHAQMVLRMLGRKVGTGGSSGYDYLKKTAEKHHIFYDLHNISTLLIPRSERPELPEDLQRELGFYFSAK